jgi:hypothetical protein
MAGERAVQLVAVIGPRFMMQRSTSAMVIARKAA